MSITGIQDRRAANSLYQLYRNQEAESATSGTSKATDTNPQEVAGIDSIKLSKPAEFFNNLQQLKTTDPERFKQITTEIAQKLKSASETETNSSGSKMLSDLAAKFQSVADGGDISQLQPPQHPGKHHGAHKYSQQNNQSLTSQLQADPNQSNSGNSVRDLISSIFDEVATAVGK